MEQASLISMHHTENTMGAQEGAGRQNGILCKHTTRGIKNSRHFLDCACLIRKASCLHVGPTGDVLTIWRFSHQTLWDPSKYGHTATVRTLLEVSTPTLGNNRRRRKCVDEKNYKEQWTFRIILSVMMTTKGLSAVDHVCLTALFKAHKGCSWRVSGCDLPPLEECVTPVSAEEDLH